VFGKNQCLARAKTRNLEQIFERSGVTLVVYGESESNQGRKHDDVIILLSQAITENGQLKRNQAEEKKLRE